MKRLFDVLVSATSMLFMAAPMLFIAMAIKLGSRGPVLHWSQRIGRNNCIFLMPKFRTMRSDTPQLATHLLYNADQWITPIGRLLRATSLDELPQLWSILVGDMTFVGPRPALFNQADLISLRTHYGVHQLVPGLTGWAQINGRDELSIPRKVEFEVDYLERQSFWFDLRILTLTAIRVVRRDGIQQAREIRTTVETQKAA